MRVPSLSIDALAALIALTQHGNFERAGRELAISASAVHKRLRTAERVLGCRLFLIDKKEIAPTEMGRKLYTDALRIIGDVSLAEQKVKALVDLGRKTVLLGHSTYLPPVLLAIVMRLESGSLGRLRIEHRSGLTPVLAQQVIEGTLHAAFGEVFDPPRPLVVRQLVEEPIVVCMPKRHRFANNRTIRPEDLDGERIVAVAREYLPQQHSEVEDILSQFGTKTRVVADAFGPSEGLVLVAQQLGICFLPVSHASSPSVVAKPLSIGKLTRKSGIYFRDDSQHQIIAELANLTLQ